MIQRLITTRTILLTHPSKTTTKVDNTKKAAKTGDTTNVAVWAFALAASAAAAGVVVKRKKEN